MVRTVTFKECHVGLRIRLLDPIKHGLRLKLGVNWYAGGGWRPTFIGAVGTVEEVDPNDRTISVGFDHKPTSLLWFAAEWFERVDEQYEVAVEVEEEIFW